MYEGAGVSYWYWGAVVCAKEKNIHLGEITPALSLVGKVKSLSLLAEGNQTPYVQRSQRFQEQMVPFCMKCLMMCASEAGVSAVLGHRGPLQNPGTLIFFIYLFFPDGAQWMKRNKRAVTLLEGKFTSARVPNVYVYVNQLQMYLQEENCLNELCNSTYPLSPP